MTDLSQSQPVQADVQPDAAVPAQGQPDNGLYPDLSAVSPDVREIVDPLLKQFEGNVTRKFQEAADFRKQWEPFQELGIQDVDPDELRELLAFRELASDPDQFKSWYEAVGKEMGLTPEAMQPAAPAADPAGLEQTLAKLLDERLGPIENAYKAQEEQARLAQAESFVQSKLDELSAEHGEFDSDAVCQLALAYEGADAIERGFADYQRLVGQVEKTVFEQKLNQPDAPAQGGRPATQVAPITDFGEAKKAALAMVQQAMST
jgi:hypothetical protein